MARHIQDTIYLLRLKLRPKSYQRSLTRSSIQYQEGMRLMSISSTEHRGQDTFLARKRQSLVTNICRYGFRLVAVNCAEAVQEEIARRGDIIDCH